MQIGIGGLLTLLFVVLKVLNVIAWSWVWVFAPLWIGLLLALVFFGIAALIVAKFGGR